MKAPAAVLLLIAALVGAVAYVTRDQRPSQHGLSSADLRYVHDYGSWWSSEFAELDQASAATQRATDLEQLTGPYRALGNCRQAYRRVAGDAPKDLQRVEDESMSACGWAERAAGLVGVNRYVPNSERQKTLAGAMTSLISADRELLAHLVLSRDLETAEEPTETSRIDSKYSAVATDVIAFNIDARCWSREDWAAIRRETAALGAETSRRFFGEAGAFEGVADLSPSACEALDEIAYEEKDVGSVDRRRLLEALVLLGRESESGAGRGDPREAQCDGLQDVRELARGLGATRADAAGLAELGWRLYRTRKLDPSLWTPACRNEGPFDKSASDVWP